MQIQVCNHGSYPATGERRSAVAAQVALGLDWVSVCPLGAGDPVTGIAADFDGACLGEAIAVAYRPAPVRRLRIQARLRNRGAGGALRAACESARAETSVPLKVSLAGPYTLSRLAQVETTAYRDLDHLATDLANHLADEVRAAVEAGAGLVQVDEPALLGAPGDVRAVRDLLEPLQDAVETRALLSVSTYGTAVGALFAQLNSLPGSIVALDCVASPLTIDDLAATGSGKPLALGMIAVGQHAEPAHIAGNLERALHRYAHDHIYLQPAGGTDAVSESQARAGLTTLLEARALLTGDSAGG